ncbi:hypothetical protein LG274_02595 [Micrococcus antarcticus]|uniref:hypothetical protein n=1 Tax=Micrococcus antarcticus TaxID=86171 RepID=UPI003850B4F7
MFTIPGTNDIDFDAPAVETHYGPLYYVPTGPITVRRDGDIEFDDPEFDELIADEAERRLREDAKYDSAFWRLEETYLDDLALEAVAA